MSKRLIHLSILFIAFLLVGIPAYATPMLRITSGATVITITDGGAGDSSGQAGVITFIGSVGNFSINVTTGITKPNLGSAGIPHMDLNSVNVTSSGGGTITIEFTDTDFGPLPSGWGFQSTLGGTTGGSVSYSAFLDTSNTAFGTGTTLFSLGPFGPGAFSNTSSASGTAASAFSLTQVLVITHTRSGQVSSGDYELEAVPEPSTLLLLGSGLAVLGFWRLRKS